MKLSKTLFNNEGYLNNIKDWNEDLAFKIANNENIVINKNHLKIIKLARKFYYEYGISPEIRMLILFIKKKVGVNIGNINYIYKLFPNYPEKKIAKISGLPKPINCFL